MALAIQPEPSLARESLTNASQTFADICEVNCSPALATLLICNPQPDQNVQTVKPEFDADSTPTSTPVLAELYHILLPPSTVSSRPCLQQASDGHAHPKVYRQDEGL